MTSFQDPEVRKCPGCEGFFLRQRLRTINFSGTRDWSDGAPTAWWAQSPLVRCRACAAIFWREDTEVVGVLPSKPWPIGRLARLLARWRDDPHGRLREEQEWLQLPDGWKSAQSADSADFEDVAYVLARSEGLSRDRLLWLRRRIWWTLNDRFRVRSDGSPIPNVPTMPEADEWANMRAILDLLEQGEMRPADMVEKGELLRLLGRLNEAAAVLRAVQPDGHSEIRASLIERLARRGDTQVRPLSDEVL
ncbi:hypothetical protein [Rugamonas apoptosis]|uniref:DUF2225 domain-containing protein n=1 Tax=Rugamonas apoptosis TaxID=2758570 RepID=A0A7W2F7V1_9BURK|nr:hypothetical protein [Rugamonas apoptosis]MBA5686720.1 hypothetical protein [Rugamonas apoptosis]